MINVPMEGTERPFLNGLYTGRIYWVPAVHLPLAANRRQPQYIHVKSRKVIPGHVRYLIILLLSLLVLKGSLVREVK